MIIMIQTPINKKRMHQLISFYETISTPPGTSQVLKTVEDNTPKRHKKHEKKSSLPIKEVIYQNTDTPIRKKQRNLRKSSKTKEIPTQKFPQRIYCVKEILTTEKTYVEGLKHFLKVCEKTAIFFLIFRFGLKNWKIL